MCMRKYVVLSIAMICSILWAGKIKPSLYAIMESVPPDSQIPILVHMVEQPDFSDFGINEKPHMIDYAKNFAQSSQTEVISYLNTQTGDWSNLKSFWVFNGFYLRATPALIESLAARNDVDYIIEDFKVMLRDGPPNGTNSIEWNITKVQADQAWEIGITGEGVIVGNMDTGVDVDHPALASKWRSNNGWYDAVNGRAYPYDDHGHGTHTMGTICGGDGFGPFENDIGVAPGATFIAVKTLDSTGGGYASWIHSGFQWVADLATYGLEPDVMNNSWGSDLTTCLEFWQDVLTWRSLGIIPIFSIGNNGPDSGTAGTPGNYPTVIGVGATDSDDDIATRSSRGPAPDMYPWSDTTYWPRDDWSLIKPNLSAPGVNIRSSLPGGGYGYKSGTSMAAAHVTGAVALVLQVNPDLGFEEIYSLLVDGADHPAQGEPYPNNDYGWGRLNAYQSLLLTPPYVELLWPNAIEIVIKEADTHLIRYNGDALAGITHVEAWFSYDGGQTWPDTIGDHEYPHNPIHVENDTILWPVTQHPTKHGRVKVVLYDNANQTAVDISDYDVTVRLATPANLSAIVSPTLTHVTLTWQDRSNYEEGYIVEKKTITGWQLKDTVHDTMYNEYVQKYRDHWYRIYGYDEPTGIHSDSIYTWATSSPILASDGITYGPRSRNIVRETLNDESLLHAVLMSNGKIIYRASTDNGYTWSSEEILDSNAHNPTISLISLGNEQLPVVAWLRDNKVFWGMKFANIWVKDSFEFEYDTLFSLVSLSLGNEVMFAVVTYFYSHGWRWKIYSLTTSGEPTLVYYEYGRPLFDAKLTLGRGYDARPTIVAELLTWGGKLTKAWEYDNNRWVERPHPENKTDYYLSSNNQLVYVDDNKIMLTSFTYKGYETPVTIYTGDSPEDPTFAQKDFVKLVMWSENSELYYIYKWSGWSSPKQITLSYRGSGLHSVVIRKQVTYEPALAGSDSIGTMAAPPPSAIHYYLQCLYTDDTKILYKEKKFLTIEFGGASSSSELSSVKLYDLIPSVVAGKMLTVRYSLADDSRVKFTVYDITGRVVRSVKLSGKQGYHTLNIDIGSLSSGIYFLVMEVPEYRAIKKFTLIR